MYRTILKKVTCFVTICAMLVSGVSITSKSVNAESSKTKLTATKSPIGIEVSTNEEGVEFSVNDDATYSLSWIANSGKTGEYLMLAWDEVKSINKLTGLKVNASSSLAFTSLSFEYSEDGEDWTVLETFTNKTETELTINQVIKAKYIRVISTGNKPIWSIDSDALFISEGEEDTTEAESKTETNTTTEAVTETESVTEKEIESETNKGPGSQTVNGITVNVSCYADDLKFAANDDETYSLKWTAQNGKLGESLTIDLGEVKSINKLSGLRIYGSSSLAFTNLKFESSTDGENWTLLDSFSDSKDVELTIDEVLVTRYLKISSVAAKPVWSVVTTDLFISEGDVPFELSRIVKSVDTERFSVGVTTSAKYLDVTDNKDGTADITWMATSGKVDEYMLFDLGKVEDIAAIKNLQLVESDTLAYTNVSLEYSTDLEEWVTLKTSQTSAAGCVLDCEKEFTARYIRVRSYGNCKPIFGVDSKNFRIVLKGEEDATETVTETNKGPGSQTVNGITVNVSCYADDLKFAANDDETYSLKWTAQNGKLGESLTIDLGEVKSINKLSGLRISGSSSLAFTNLKFESSTDGENWTLLDSFSDSKDVELTIDEVLVTRYLKISSVAAKPVWSVGTTDLFISEGDAPFESNPIVKTIKTSKYTVGVTAAPEKLDVVENEDGTAKIEWVAESGQTDEYIIFDLGEAKDVTAIKNLTVSKTNSLGYTNLSLEYSEDLNDWTVLRSATSKTNKDYTFDYSGDFKARYIRLRSYGNSVPVFVVSTNAFDIVLKEDAQETKAPETTAAATTTTTVKPTTLAPTTTKKVEETTTAAKKVALKVKASAKKVNKAKKYQFKFYKNASDCKKDKKCVMSKTVKKRTVTAVISAEKVEKYGLEDAGYIYFKAKSYKKKWSKWSAPKKAKATEVEQ